MESFDQKQVNPRSRYLFVSTAVTVPKLPLPAVIPRGSPSSCSQRTRYGLQAQSLVDLHYEIELATHLLSCLSPQCARSLATAPKHFVRKERP
jgi:hypothetical protein